MSRRYDDELDEELSREEDNDQPVNPALADAVTRFKALFPGNEDYTSPALKAAAQLYHSDRSTLKPDERWTLTETLFGDQFGEFAGKPASEFSARVSGRDNNVYFEHTHNMQAYLAEHLSADPFWTVFVQEVWSEIDYEAGHEYADTADMLKRMMKWLKILGFTFFKDSLDVTTNSGSSREMESLLDGDFCFRYINVESVPDELSEWLSAGTIYFLWELWNGSPVAYQEPWGNEFFYYDLDDAMVWCSHCDYRWYSESGGSDYRDENSPWHTQVALDDYPTRVLEDIVLKIQRNLPVPYFAAYLWFGGRGRVTYAEGWKTFRQFKNYVGFGFIRSWPVKLFVKRISVDTWRPISRVRDWLLRRQLRAWDWLYRHTGRIVQAEERCVNGVREWLNRIGFANWYYRKVKTWRLKRAAAKAVIAAANEGKKTDERYGAVQAYKRHEESLSQKLWYTAEKGTWQYLPSDYIRIHGTQYDNGRDYTFDEKQHKIVIKYGDERWEFNTALEYMQPWGVYVYTNKPYKFTFHDTYKSRLRKWLERRTQTARRRLTIYVDPDEHTATCPVCGKGILQGGW